MRAFEASEVELAFTTRQQNSWAICARSLRLRRRSSAYPASETYYLPLYRFPFFDFSRAEVHDGVVLQRGWHARVGGRVPTPAKHSINELTGILSLRTLIEAIGKGYDGELSMTAR